MKYTVVLKHFLTYKQEYSYKHKHNLLTFTNRVIFHILKRSFKSFAAEDCCIFSCSNLVNSCPEDEGNIFLRKSVPAVCIHCHNPDRELPQRHWKCTCSISCRHCGTVRWGMKWSKITTMKMSPTPNAGHVTGCRRIAQECGWLPSTTPRTLICGDRFGWRNAKG